MRRRLPLQAACLLILANISLTGHAHVPSVELKDSSAEQPIIIDWSLDISVAIYAYLENGRDVDVVRFSINKDLAAKGQRLYVHTLVPACSAYRHLLPTVAIIGPRQTALPEPTTDRGALPFTLQPGEGIQLLENRQQGTTWYEPYSKKNYFWQRSRILTLTEPGEYTLRVWSKDHQVGDYVLAVGTRERWGLREIGRAVRHMPRLLAHREIHNPACRRELQQQAPSSNPLPRDAHQN